MAKTKDQTPKDAPAPTPDQAEAEAEAEAARHHSEHGKTPSK